MKVVPLACVALAACSFSGKLGGSTLSSGSGPSSTSSSSGDSTRPAPMPDVRGKTPAEAEALLRSAGFTVASTTEQTEDLCGEGEDHQMARQGTICKQRPEAGATTYGGTVRLTYTLEHDAWEGGSNGPGEWRRVPDVVGKPLDVARTLLARAQLPIETSFEVIEVVEPGCAARTICKISPGPKQRKQVRMQGRLYVGLPQPVAAPPPTVDPTDPTPPATTPPPAAKPDTYF